MFKNYPFTHLNNSDYFKSVALAHFCFYSEMERELFTSNRIWINPINPFKVHWDKPTKYHQCILTVQLKLAFILTALYFFIIIFSIFKRHQIANQIVKFICDKKIVTVDGDRAAPLTNVIPNIWQSNQLDFSLQICQMIRICSTQWRFIICDGQTYNTLQPIPS